MKEVTTLNGVKPDLKSELELMQHENKELKSRLEELTKEMNQFTYVVSHDLQAPLRTITGFMELLERRYGDKLDDSAKQFISYAVKGAAKMKDLVFDLLEYSRLNTGIREMAEVDLNEIVKEVCTKLSTAIEESGVVITYEQLPIVNAIRGQMMQLFYHLIDNAIKFRNGLAPEIDITLKKENGFYVVGIKDNGIGIDPAFFEKIFIVFRKLNTDEVRYPGTGIGLAVCKKIAELHGGTMTVESALGKGSSFYFTLPTI